MIAGPNCKLSKFLVPGLSPTVFQAELHAVEICAEEYITSNFRNSSIYLFTDRQAVLKTLRSFTMESKLAWNYLGVLNKLWGRNKVIIMRVPGHSGVEENENAGELAKQGTNCCFVGPETIFSTPKSYFTSTVRQWTEKEILHIRETWFHSQHNLSTENVQFWQAKIF